MNNFTKLTLKLIPAMLSIPCFIKAHEKTILEINNQLNKFGFYKEDIITLRNDYILKNWYLGIGIVLAIIGLLLSLTSIIDFTLKDNIYE